MMTDQSNLLTLAKAISASLATPVPERQRAAETIDALIALVAEVRSQRDALRVCVAALEQENIRLRNAPGAPGAPGAT